ncbi:hypothetical protein [Hymenobacter koreensis]|uniref:Uncharacterized protein n=1 Tax=Hymenobacter koreensis TaxID=1084523 RepID=A0ABP8ITH9_9BACT
MTPQPRLRHPYRLLPSKRVFFITLAVSTFTVLLVWFIGLRQDWSLFKDSLITLTVLSISFFAFVTVGLWSGVKLQDTLGTISTTERLKKLSLPDSLPSFDSGDFNVDGEGCGAIILAVFA